MNIVDIDTLPDEIRSRVLASTGNATHRLVQRTDGPEDAPAAYAIEAVSGDRVTLTRLSLRPDGSVDENTDSFTVHDVVEIDDAADELTVRAPSGPRVFAVAPETIKAVEAIGT